MAEGFFNEPEPTVETPVDPAPADHALTVAGAAVEEADRAFDARSMEYAEKVHAEFGRMGVNLSSTRSLLVEHPADESLPPNLRPKRQEEILGR